MYLYYTHFFSLLNKTLYITFIKWIHSIYIHYPTLLIILLCYLKGINIDDQIKETDPKQLLKTIEDKKNQNFPENYRTCMNFFQLLRNVAQAGT